MNFLPNFKTPKRYFATSNSNPLLNPLEKPLSGKALSGKESPKSFQMHNSSVRLYSLRISCKGSLEIVIF